jgi:hypothetical protein
MRTFNGSGNFMMESIKKYPPINLIPNQKMSSAVLNNTTLVTTGSNSWIWMLG